MKENLERLIKIEKRIGEIAKEFGLLTTEIIFEIVPVQRMLEAMSYLFPVNFSHWSFGRNYDKLKTIYEYTGSGIPYEQVWNFDTPRAFIVKTNPFALNALVVAHVYGHVDFFLGSRYLKHGRLFADLAEETRLAAERFRKYEVKYGRESVEKTIESGMSIMWQQHPDPFLEEELDDQKALERLLALERAKLERTKDLNSEFRKEPTEKELKRIENRLKSLEKQRPPRPIYDLLGYIINYSPVLKSWQKDILNVIRNQARGLAPLRRTKILDEGWATYWHVRIMRQLFKEGYLTSEEHGVFNEFHSRVIRENKMDLNWYRVGLMLFEDIEDRWNKGKFGKEYSDCEDPNKKAYWDTKMNKGREKIFQVRSFYSDRMAVEELFTDEFIRMARLYIYNEVHIPNGDIYYAITEDRPEEIRKILKALSTLYGIQPIIIQNSDWNSRDELYLVHRDTNLGLESKHRDGTLENIFYLWGKRVHLETTDDKRMIYSFDGKHKERNK